MFDYSNSQLIIKFKINYLMTYTKINFLNIINITFIKFFMNIILIKNLFYFILNYVLYLIKV